MPGPLPLPLPGRVCFHQRVGIDFAASERPTLGVEWEFALVDKDTRDLSNTAAELFARVYDEEGTQDPSCTRSCCATPSRW